MFFKKHAGAALLGLVTFIVVSLSINLASAISPELEAVFSSGPVIPAQHRKLREDVYVRGSEPLCSPFRPTTAHENCGQ
jgi:hypothetical protein